MGVKVDKAYRIRKARSEQSTRLPLAHKIRQGGDQYDKHTQQCIHRRGASREVMLKITGHAKTPRGIKNALDYLSRQADLSLHDDQGREYQEPEELKNNYDYMIEAGDKRRVTEGEKTPYLSHNMTFSSPAIANVPPKIVMDSVRKTLKERYPDNRFIMAYHEDTKNPHVHVVWRIPDNGGTRIMLRKADLRHLRIGFAQKLQAQGYAVNATHRRDFTLKDKRHSAPEHTRHLYEVMDFGRTYYQYDTKNKKQHYLQLRTLSGKKDVTFWGVNLANEITREKVIKGSVISLKKEGVTRVKVPHINKNGEIVGFKETKRNHWRIENQGIKNIDRAISFNKTITLDSPQQLLAQRQGMRQFEQSKMALLKQQENKKLGIRMGFVKF